MWKNLHEWLIIKLLTVASSQEKGHGKGLFSIFTLNNSFLVLVIFKCTVQWH